MVIIRLCYVADLPTPEDAVRMIQSGAGQAPQGPNGGGVPQGGGGGQMAQAVGAPVMNGSQPSTNGPQAAMRVVNGGLAQAQSRPAVAVQTEEVTEADPQTFQGVVDLA